MHNLSSITLFIAILLCPPKSIVLGECLNLFNWVSFLRDYWTKPEFEKSHLIMYQACLDPGKRWVNYPLYKARRETLINPWWNGTYLLCSNSNPLIQRGVFCLLENLSCLLQIYLSANACQPSPYLPGDGRQRLFQHLPLPVPRQPHCKQHCNKRDR